MALTDEVTLQIKAGKGGDGVVRWIREKFKPKSGPGGGNGGRGGDVYAEAVADLQILDQYRFKKKWNAPNGEAGGNRNCDGAKGEDLVLTFPVGTILKRMSNGEVIELTHIGEKIKILSGGHGGLGNAYFKSSRNTTPYESTPGKPAESDTFQVELQLIADIGLIGLPSAGKSTLLNAMTNAQSKVGAYHFTTLEPHLGVTPDKIILADIPGLIEGAADGKGLGHKFLRHIKRTKILAHCVSVENEDMAKAYREIRTELEQYDVELGNKQEIIIVTKTDLVEEKELAEKIALVSKASKNKNILTVSAWDEDSIKKLAAALYQEQQKQLS